MRRVFVLVGLSLLLSTQPAAASADRTTALLGELDRCDPSAADITPGKLRILLELADGRSAKELRDLISGPRRCSGYAFAFGDGDDEIALVGAPRAGDTVGAILWVDRGWWRIAATRIGYMPYPVIDSRHDGARELVIGIASGGSAGDVGLIGLRLKGATATTILILPPASAGEINRVRAIDDDHILAEGRLPARLVTWNSHAGWPGGAQWLFERRGSSFALVARRQARDPEYVESAFIGALIARDPSTMRGFATEAVVATALALPQAIRFNGAVGALAGRDLLERERMSWDALPDGVRAAPPSGPAWGTLPVFEGPSELQNILVRFDRDSDGWIITELAGESSPSPADDLLVP